MMHALFILIALGGTVLPNSQGPDSTCVSTAGDRQLDYWLGTWTVTAPGSTHRGTSTVAPSLDRCIVVETWDGGRGHTGENVLAYSADDQSWQGMFADNQGRVHLLQGTVTADSAEFRGTSRGATGEVMNRLRLVRISADRVAETWEKSSDGGATWSLEFHLDYTRTAPSR